MTGKRTNGSSHLVVERVPDMSALRRLVPEWEALHRAMTPRTPFNAPSWNLLWWEHFAERRLAVADELFVHVVRRPGGELVAVAPMVLTRRPGRGPASVRALQFFGADANVTELRGLVCRTEDEPAAFRALFEHFISRADEWDFLHWHGMRNEDDVLAPLAASGLLRPADSIPDYVLSLPDTWEAFRSRLSRNIKESLRKCYNSLKRDGHEFTFRVVSEPGQARAAVEKFFELHSSRAAVTGTVQHGDVFAAPRSRAFLLDFAEDAARRDTLRAFQLVIAGKVVATRVGFLAGDELYLYFSGYDEAWSKYSVMTTTVAEAIKWAIEQKLRLVNLSPGSDVSKLRWGPTEIAFRHAVHVSPTLRGRFAFEAYHAVLRQSQASGRVATLLNAIGVKR